MAFALDLNRAIILTCYGSLGLGIIVTKDTELLC